MKTAYQAVADDVLRRIRSGEWGQGDRLPTLDEMVGLYPQSRMTLYKAMRLLTDQGFLTMARGRGTFVRAVERPRRVAILAGAAFAESDYHPFAFRVFRHAHAYFTGRGLDAQLYAEDPRGSNGLPLGLQDELEHRRLAAMLTIPADKTVCTG